MKKKSIKEMLEAIAPVLPADEKEGEKAGDDRGFAAAEAERKPAEPSESGSAAERLGRALLSSLGALEGVSEDEIVEAILGEWKPEKAGSAGKSDGSEREGDAEEPPIEVGDIVSLADGDRIAPDWESVATPVPMRTSAQASRPVDYSEMSAEQFNKLKRLLKKAAADGKRIRL